MFVNSELVKYLSIVYTCTRYIMVYGFMGNKLKFQYYIEKVEWIDEEVLISPIIILSVLSACYN